MFLYEIAPVDHNWNLLRKVDLKDEYVKNILDRAREHGWEGDFTEVPRVMVLPPDNGGCDFSFAFVWKQSNNGTTFIASEIELPQLGEAEEI